MADRDEYFRGRIVAIERTDVQEIAGNDHLMQLDHDLYRRGLSVGQEHITALVNTLVLAYAGASLPLFLIFAIQIDEPLWVTLNSEFVAEEIVQALVGSLALVFAVPITTWLAAQLLRAQDERGLPSGNGPHPHFHG